MLEPHQFSSIDELAVELTRMKLSLRLDTVFTGGKMKEIYLSLGLSPQPETSEQFFDDRE